MDGFRKEVLSLKDMVEPLIKDLRELSSLFNKLDKPIRELKYSINKAMIQIEYLVNKLK